MASQEGKKKKKKSVAFWTEETDKIFKQQKWI